MKELKELAYMIFTLLCCVCGAIIVYNNTSLPLFFGIWLLCSGMSRFSEIGAKIYSDNKFQSKITRSTHD
jgi:hypothetical protein